MSQFYLMFNQSNFFMGANDDKIKDVGEVKPDNWK